MIRYTFDKICRVGIKMLMLTGVAFTMAACYGPPPEGYHFENEPEWQNDQQQLEKRLAETAEEISEE